MGDYESIYGFGALGLDIYSCEETEEAKKIFKKLCAGAYAVVYITESCAKGLEEEIKKANEKLLPAVVLIPGAKDNTGEGMNNISRMVVRAVGADI